MSAIEWSWTVLVTLVGLGLITWVSRGFFLIPEREVPLPPWLKQGLRYAPLAALVAVIAPEVVMQQGQVITTLKDARIYAALAGAAWYRWRHDILGTIVAGMAVMLALRLGLGW